MFSVRVELNRNSHMMYECARYVVIRMQREVQIKLHNPDEIVTLQNGSVAYVMNEQGVTVDVIRTRK